MMSGAQRLDEEHGSDSEEFSGVASTAAGAASRALPLPSCDGSAGLAIPAVGCCAGVLLFGLILGSFAGLHATKLALTRNKLTGVVSFDKVYKGGRNFIGAWNEYIEFPATIQSIEWLPGVPMEATTRDLSPVSVRTRDGLMVELSVMVQYFINPATVPDMYRKYKTDYESFFISYLRSSIQSLTAEFTAIQLCTDRPKVIDALLQTCRNVCADNLEGFLSCWGVQLLELTFSQTIEDAKIRTMVEEQRQRTETMVQRATFIRAETQVLEANFDRAIQVVQATASAQANNITIKAKSDADANWQQAKNEVLQLVSNAFRATGMPVKQTDILGYLEKIALIDSPSGPLVYGDFSQATIFARGNEL